MSRSGDFGQMAVLLESLLRDSYKFLRLTDDLQDMAQYLNDIRICFIALTVSLYATLVLYFLSLCYKRVRRGNEKYRRNMDIEEGTLYNKWNHQQQYNRIQQPSQAYNDQYAVAAQKMPRVRGTALAATVNTVSGDTTSRHHYGQPTSHHAQQQLYYGQSKGGGGKGSAGVMSPLVEQTQDEMPSSSLPPLMVNTASPEMAYRQTTTNDLTASAVVSKENGDLLTAITAERMTHT